MLRGRTSNSALFFYSVGLALSHIHLLQALYVYCCDYRNSSSEGMEETNIILYKAKQIIEYNNVDLVDFCTFPCYQKEVVYLM